MVTRLTYQLSKLLVRGSDLKNRLGNLLIRGEEGASFTEYGLLLVIVVFAIAATGTILGTEIIAFLDNVGTTLSGGTIPDPTP